MKCIIFDLDGTICRVDPARLAFLHKEPADWQSFHDGLVNDTANEPVAWLAKTLFAASIGASGPDEFSVILVTARHEPYRQKTENWLRENHIKYDRLYMREDRDTRPDHIVKIELLSQVIDDGYVPFLVVDDRPEVVEAWRSYGLACLQCEYDDPSKYQGKVMLTLLVGPSGCGKSTFAEKNYKPNEIISTDRIREEEGFGHDPYDVQQTFALARGYAAARIKIGKRAVIDATNLNQKIRLGFCALVPKGGLVEYVLLDREYDQKLRDRGWRPEKLIADHHKRFRDSTLAELKNTDGQGNIIIIDKREHKV